jgi:hypothetical protein
MRKCYGARVATKSKAKPRKPAAKKKPAPKAAKAVTRTRASTMQGLPPPPPPAPPAPAPPPPPREEMHAPRDIGRLTRYGERFGPWKIDTRLLQHIQLPVASGALAICDPGVPKSWRVFDRPVSGGLFRVMLSYARRDDGGERLAAITIHVGRPPIAKWTVAHYKGQKRPKSSDQLPRCASTSGWLAVIDAGAGSPGVIAVPEHGATAAPIDVPLTDGRHALAVDQSTGEFAAYWAVDAADKPICLVVDFDVFTAKEWKARPLA